MIENPFINRGPIKDPAYFFNREQETRRILEMLSKGQSISLIGPRKIGKTSLLFHISRTEILRKHNIDPAQHLVVFVDCQALPNMKLEEFYVLVLQNIANQGSQLNHPISTPKGKIPFSEFNALLRKNFEHKSNLTLLLDEFEILTRNREIGTRLLSGLRSLVTSLNISYLTVSQRQLTSFTDEYSPFFNYCIPLKLGLFEVSDSRSLITSLLEKVNAYLPINVVNFILELGGGHPFFLQVAGFWAFDFYVKQKLPINNETLQKLKQNVQSQVEEQYAYYWRHLDDREKYALITLQMTQDQETYRKEIEEIARLCLITKHNEKYDYFSPLFFNFVRRQKIENIIQSGPFVIDKFTRQVLLSNQPISLSATHFDLLSYFMEHLGQVVTNEELDREVLAAPEEQLSYTYLDNQRTKNAIKGLRKALGEAGNYIENIRGIGFSLQIPAIK